MCTLFESPPVPNTSTTPQSVTGIDVGAVGGCAGSKPVKQLRFGGAAGFIMSQYCGSSEIEAQVVRARRSAIGSLGGVTHTPHARTAGAVHEAAVVTELQNCEP